MIWNLICIIPTHDDRFLTCLVQKVAVPMMTRAIRTEQFLFFPSVLLNPADNQINDFSHLRRSRNNENGYPEGK